MTFNGKEYKVIKTLYRTKGSHNQRLAEHISEETKERRRRFYLVERNGRKYFVKEYHDREYGGNLGYPKNIEYEYETTKRLYGDITRRHGTIGVPKVIAREDERILFEYLDGYRKPHVNELQAIHRLVLEWLRSKDIDNYDLCANNILVKVLPKRKNGVTQYEVRMIDFEYSEDRKVRREYGIE
jgi:hypothetical protein